MINCATGRCAAKISADIGAMRIWSLHPRYLDSKGLVALWREALLARHVLSGSTKGYRNHPQLERFKAVDFPVEAINGYLAAVHEESVPRAYHFHRRNSTEDHAATQLQVNRGQLEHEFAHLMKKLATRDPSRRRELLALKKILPHPMFTVVKGGVEEWERLVP